MSSRQWIKGTTVRKGGAATSSHPSRHLTPTVQSTSSTVFGGGTGSGAGAGDVEKDIRTFLSAIARYRRIAALGTAARSDEYELRKALGDVVFDAAIETSPRLEEARDQVVEMLWKQRANGGRRVRYAQA